MITTTITLDISRDQLDSDRRATGSMYGITPGSRVIINVGGRWVVNPETATQLREYVGILHLDLHGTQKATERWANALRDPRWAEV